MGKFIDLTGQKFGKLTVIERANNRNSKVHWKCQCDCGNIVEVSRDGLMRGKTQSCGCIRIIDLSGKRFGKLLVQERVGIKYGDGALWLCKCDCGNEKVISTKNLLHSNKGKGTQSCGCLAVENHPFEHNKSKTRVYRIWQKMKQRCYNPNHKHFEYYGGRGICVCKEWLDDFMNFYNWAMKNGYSDELSIDRIDGDGNYEPANCRWATQKEQMNNVRSNHKITFNGKTLTTKQWSEELGISYQTIQTRLRKDLPISEVLSKEKLY